MRIAYLGQPMLLDGITLGWMNEDMHCVSNSYHGGLGNCMFFSSRGWKLYRLLFLVLELLFGDLPLFLLPPVGDCKNTLEIALNYACLVQLECP